MTRDEYTAWMIASWSTPYGRLRPGGHRHIARLWEREIAGTEKAEARLRARVGPAPEGPLEVYTGGEHQYALHLTQGDIDDALARERRRHGSRHRWYHA